MADMLGLISRGDLFCAEFYAATEPDRLLGAVDVPRKHWEKAAQALGKMICRVRGMDSVNALILDGYGSPVERLLINR